MRQETITIQTVQMCVCLCKCVCWLIDWFEWASDRGDQFKIWLIRLGIESNLRTEAECRYAYWWETGFVFNSYRHFEAREEWAEFKNLSVTMRSSHILFSWMGQNIEQLFINGSMRMFLRLCIKKKETKRRKKERERKRAIFKNRRNPLVGNPFK